MFPTLVTYTGLMVNYLTKCKTISLPLPLQTSWINNSFYFFSPWLWQLELFSMKKKRKASHTFVGKYVSLKLKVKSFHNSAKTID